MFDAHSINSESWGVRPVLFELGGFKVESYTFFVMLALIVGGLVYYFEARKVNALGQNSENIALAALVGGAIGAKLPIWILNYRQIIDSGFDLGLVLSGRTVTGGLLGGFLAVWLTKKHLGIKEKRGNLFAPAVAIGIAIGRFGCFLRGCCFGVPTDLPWGVDFGDGLHRHPTELYEAIFALGLFIWIKLIGQKKFTEPGQLFRVTLIIYFVFRFFIEFIRDGHEKFLDVTVYQWISLFAIVWLSRDKLFRALKSE